MYTRCRNSSLRSETELTDTLPTFLLVVINVFGVSPSFSYTILLLLGLVYVRDFRRRDFDAGF